MSVFSAGSLFFLVADRLKDYGFNYSVLWLTPILFVGSIFFCLLLGWFDFHSGMYKEEVKYGSVNNVVMMEILERIKKLEEAVKKDAL
jgi:hypothetical protein